MKYLIVKPLGGLANRMRMLESAYCYAKKYSAQLTVIWERNGILNARYADCFLPVEGARIIEADYNGDSVISKLKRQWYNAAEWAGTTFFTTKKLHDISLESILQNGQADEAAITFFDELAKKNKGIFIESCFEFYPNPASFRLSIQEEIQNKATASLRQHPSVVGIHIRRTDNIDSINHSPLEKFIEKINSRLTISPSDAFYLSTDSEEVVHQLRDMFQDKIITGVSVRTRDSKEGIISALVDLYCLSQCKLILGSYKSSFSERAALIGNIPLQIVSV